jgi:uncharacterized glyoxalase superfamily protein PhnB
MPISPVPDGYHSVTPLLHVRDVAGLIQFLERAFAAVETGRVTHSDGRIVHAEVRIGDSRVMLGEPWGDAEFPPGTHYVYLYVKDTDTVYRRALEAGATSLMEPAEQFWGDRLAGVEDPAGIRWWIATRTREVFPPPPRHW